MRSFILFGAIGVAMLLSAVSTSTTTASAAPICPPGWTEAQCAVLAKDAYAKLGSTPTGQAPTNFAYLPPGVKFPCPAHQPNGYIVKTDQIPGWDLTRVACTSGPIPQGATPVQAASAAPTPTPLK